MHRTQIQLTDEQLTALRRMASAQDRSIADLIRQSVDSLIESERADRQAAMARALKEIGQHSSGLSDLSTRHDDYFVEAILESKRGE